MKTANREFYINEYTKFDMEKAIIYYKLAPLDKIICDVSSMKPMSMSKSFIEWYINSKYTNKPL